MNAIEVRGVTKTYRRYGRRKQFGTLKSALLSGRGLRDLRADETLNALKDVSFDVTAGRTFGIVASTTQPFCASCDRSRLTADGMWYRCLYAASGTDLRSPLRDGGGPDEVRAVVAATWAERSDQGAVERLAMPTRGVAVPVTVLRRDPHLEMHTRGG